MHPELFDLDWSRWQVILLSVLPATINLLIFLYAFLFVEKTKSNIYFTLFVLFLGLWQSGEALMRFSVTKEGATEWQRVSEIFVMLPIPFGILFVFKLTGWLERQWQNLLSIFLYAPLIIFAVLIECRQDEYDLLRSDVVFWIVNPRPSLVTLGITIWMTAGAISMLVILWTYYFRTKGGEQRKKQALILAGGLSIPILVGLICELVLPFLFKSNDIPVTGSLLSFFSVSSIIAIRKYKMLEYSPRHQWDQIVATIVLAP